MQDGIVRDSKAPASEHAQRVVERAGVEQMARPHQARPSLDTNAEPVPLTPADPRFRAYWASRTTAEAEAAGVSQIAACRNGVHCPHVLEAY